MIRHDDNNDVFSTDPLIPVGISSSLHASTPQPPTAALHNQFRSQNLHFRSVFAEISVISQSPGKLRVYKPTFIVSKIVSL